ncbi:hypothetical protein MIMGU_mgv1a022044mg [Erythranthe guttata]|uniref:non-specific serine/threonine protein kinase n=1 Tax=Erythranthe guttata TaxID=4155 RepID=A0A022QCN4_ERYGU|nr:hypothetical protein MIMGU_mgv1a022044mg [Erythranthe guttata]
MHFPSTDAISIWFDSDDTHPCNWTGIKCNQGHRRLTVTKIDMSFSLSPLNLPFPTIIGEFKSLKHLNLSHCAFTGHIFPEFWDFMLNLEVLDLSDNRLSGQLPPIIGQLKHLKQLILDDNNFSGTLPSTIGQLTGLTELSLQSNSFSGNIPDEIGNLNKIESLDISSNFFSGKLPLRISNLTRLLFFDAKQNRFTGNLPPEIGNLRTLQILDLSSNSLSGDLPSSIGNLTNLSYLNLASNDFDGGLPLSIGKLANLVYLIAPYSGLKGRIPSQLGNCKNLKILDLSFNSFDGILHDELAGLDSVTSIILTSNRLSGGLPVWTSNWKQIQSLSISNNLFSGPLPPLDQMPLLSVFDADSNMLSGELSAQILCERMPYLTSLVLSRNNFSGTIYNGTFKNCLNLTYLILSENNISGQLPAYIGEMNLVNFEISTNKLSGKIPDRLWESKTLMGIILSDNMLEDIPSELFNCTRLVSLDLGGNRLTGRIPKSISKLKMLDNLVLSYNRITGPIPEEICSGFQKVSLPDSEYVQHYGMLDLSYNELEGNIPPSIKNCLVVKEVLFNGNKLNGSIPEEIASLSNLTLLDLSFNSFTGLVVPQFFSTMNNIQGLVLSHNQLQGFASYNNSWSALQSLAKLDISNNFITGELPPSLFSLKSLTYLDASVNNLSESLTIDLVKGAASSLLVLNISNNKFNGTLDNSISNLASLSVLDIHNNMFTGSVPSSLPNLSALTYLDLSENNFENSFPCNVCAIQGLVFTNFSANSFADDDSPKSCMNVIKPCGTTPGLLHSLSTTSPIFSRASAFGLAIGCVSVFLIVFIGLTKWKSKRNNACTTRNALHVMTPETNTSSEGLLHGKKTQEPLSINIATFEHSLLRIKADEISSATENFSKSHIIGEGGFGTVYRASLPKGQTIAVKRLNGCHLHGEREFLAELETIGKVKHENLVQLLGYSVFADERILIYEYMENGSLDYWLRNEVAALDWPTRFKICLGSARGVAFLHHGFVPHIIHRDIKSSNILLGQNFEARVSDFGLARIISACESHVSTVLAGTFGYIPPEYGQAMVATTKGDVYSFGVVMLELVTGREPIGQADVEGGNLVGWVRWMLDVSGRDPVEVLDPSFLAGSGFLMWRDQMLSVLSIARSCTSDEPWMRPTMFEVVKLLKMAKIMRNGNN